MSALHDSKCAAGQQMVPAADVEIFGLILQPAYRVIKECRMERAELDSLLMTYQLEFFWDEDKRVWWVAGKTQRTEPQKAVNLQAAQFAAVQYIENRMTRPKDNYSNSDELDRLLAKHRMSFHWSDVGHKWFVIWQAPGGNNLEKSDPKPAVNRWEAQMAAVDFINRMFE
jgi:hypothetical protein